MVKVGEEKRRGGGLNTLEEGRLGDEREVGNERERERKKNH